MDRRPEGITMCKSVAIYNTRERNGPNDKSTIDV